MKDTYDLELSQAAQQRQHAMLPGLLAAVGHRRRRRATVRALAAVLLLALGGVAIAFFSRSQQAPRPGPQHGAPGQSVPGQSVPPAHTASWSTFRDDPTVAQRCVVATVSRAEWFVSDDDLNRLLLEDGRPTGVIRAGGRVAVNASAFDPWPERKSE